MKRDLLLKISLLLLLSSLSAGCQVHLGAEPESTTITHTDSEYEVDREVNSFVYSEPDWPQALRADLYLPQRSGPLPVVMVIHGGGWANRSREDMTSISLALAERGYAVMNLDYRFAPRYTYPAQLDDLQQAREWLTAMPKIGPWTFSIVTMPKA